jgi:hypothetical protein
MTGDDSMLFRKSRPISYPVVAVFSVARAAAQSALPRRESDVPCVATAEPTVQTMLKLGEVKKTDIAYDLG